MSDQFLNWNWSKLSKRAAVALTLLTVFPQSADAGGPFGLSNMKMPVVPAPPNTELFSQLWMDQRFDWVFRLQPTMYTNYLKYPGSQLNPMLSMKVTFRVVPRLAPDKEDKTYDYETLWFAQGKTIGCKRNRDLPFSSGWQGIIYCAPETVPAQEPAAYAAAIVRLLLDIKLKGCQMTYIFMPPDAVQPVVNELHKYNFYELTEGPTTENSGLLQIYLASAPGKDQVFLYHKTAR